jgi:hypothetical protein
VNARASGGMRPNPAPRSRATIHRERPRLGAAPHAEGRIQRCHGCTRGCVGATRTAPARGAQPRTAPRETTWLPPPRHLGYACRHHEGSSWDAGLALVALASSSASPAWLLVDISGWACGRVVPRARVVHGRLRSCIRLLTRPHLTAPSLPMQVGRETSLLTHKGRGRLRAHPADGLCPTTEGLMRPLLSRTYGPRTIDRRQYFSISFGIDDESASTLEQR